MDSKEFDRAAAEHKYVLFSGVDTTGLPCGFSYLLLGVSWLVIIDATG